MMDKGHVSSAEARGTYKVFFFFFHLLDLFSFFVRNATKNGVNPHREKAFHLRFAKGNRKNGASLYTTTTLFAWWELWEWEAALI